MSALKCHNFIPCYPVHALCPIIGTSSSSEDPDEMQPYATSHQVFRVGSHVVFAWIHCTDVRIHCTDILIECR